MFCKLPGKVSGFSFLVFSRSEEGTCRKPETNNQKRKTGNQKPTKKACPVNRKTGQAAEEMAAGGRPPRSDIMEYYLMNSISW
jgi:hypothetical protein